MEPSLEDLVERLVTALEASAEMQGSLLEALKDANARTLELAEDVADVGRRLRIAEVAIAGLVSTIEHEAAELHERITTVHQAAIKELTRNAERSTTA